MKLDEHDKAALKGVYAGKGEAGELDMSPMESNLRLAFALRSPFGQSFFPEAAEEEERVNMRREEEGVFLDVDEFPSDIVEQEAHNEDVRDELLDELDELNHQRQQLERAADRLLAKHGMASTDTAPRVHVGYDYRKHPDHKPRLKKHVVLYPLFAVVYDMRRKVRMEHHRPIVGMKPIAA